MNTLAHTKPPAARTPVSDKGPASSLSTILMFLLLAVVYLGAAFTPALQDDADSTHSEAAREMYVSHDYVTLHVNGIRYLEKAPLPYWLVVASFHAFGVNAFATRFPTVVTMFLLALLAWRWGSRAFGDRAGLYAGLFVATTAGYFLFTRIFIPDAMLSLWIAASFYFLLTALEDAGTWRWYAGYACLALAVMTKGLVPLVFVGATAVAYLVLTGNWRRWREFRLGSGSLLFLAIAAPWHILAGIRNQHFFWFYFVNEHFLRFLGKRYPADYNKLPATLYWSLHLAWLFPWSLYLPVALKRVVRDFRSGWQGSLAEHTRLLCWLWAGIVLLFFSFSTNQEYYTMPAYLPLLLLIAAAVAAAEISGKSAWLNAGAALIAIVSCAGSAALVVGLWSSRHHPFVADIGSVLTKHQMSNDTLSMSHMLDLTGESFAALRLPATLAVIAFLGGGIGALILRLRRQHYRATWTTALGIALLLVAAHIALVRFGPYLSSQELAARIERVAEPQDMVAIYGDQAYGSSLLFYLQRPIDLINGNTTSMWFGSTFPDAPRVFLQDAQLMEAWNSSRRVFLFVPAYERPQVESLLTGEKHIIAEASGKIVYSNRP